MFDKLFDQAPQKLETVKQVSNIPFLGKSVKKTQQPSIMKLVVLYKGGNNTQIYQILMI